MGEVTREELAAMTDHELLAYEREHHGDPYMTLLRAKGMQRVALQFWHIGEAGRRCTERPRRRPGVACFRSCFRPTPLVSVSSAAELDVAKVARTRTYAATEMVAHGSNVNSIATNPQRCAFAR